MSQTAKLQFGRNSPAVYAPRVNFLRLAILALCLATYPGRADSTANQAVASAPASSTNDMEQFDKIEAADDATQAEVDKWVRQNNDLKARGTAIPDNELERHISERFEPIRKAYDDFVRSHPANARARFGYGNFLNDRHDEIGAQVQWEKALELDPGNPALYNSLAGRYTERGPVDKAFEFFTRAIELRPTEAAYYHNFGDSLYVLRKRAATYYQITEQQVFQKVVLLYSNALRLDSQNFDYARDLAQTYYSFKPLPVEAALSAWTNALNAAQLQTDREDVYVNLARVKMLTGRFDEARTLLGAVTNQACLIAKTNLLRNIAEREKQKP
jgi:Flp pilus assembly protein TadD